MQVLMIRHSLAKDDSPQGDFGRALTPEGCDRFAAVSDWLNTHGVQVEKVIHSPRVRAVQTAEILCQRAAPPTHLREELDWLGSGFPVSDLFSEINRSAVDCLAVVGHEPSMSSCTAQMIGGGRLRFFPGSVASIVFHHHMAQPGQGTLNWFLDPFLFEVA